MFLTGALNAAGLGNNNDPEQERDPPPQPTPVTFPTHPAFEGVIWNAGTPPPDFQSLFATVLKPSDVSEQHKQALNITILPSCAVDQLVPLATDGTSHLPNIEPQESQNEQSYADAAKADPEMFKKRKNLSDRVSELRIENDMAFRAITRTLVQGVRPPKLAYMRKFWEGLENMSPYWDCSLDCYYEKEDDDGEKSAKRQRLGSVSNVGNPGDGPGMGRALPLLYGKTSCDDQENQHPDDDAGDHEASHQHDSSITPSDTRIRMRYKGRRTGTGRAMPDQFRADMVRGFVEGTIWPFQASLSSPRRMPLVRFHKLNLPVRQTAAVYRIPRDRIRGRQGWLEGPILNVQARPETDFDANGSEAEVKARLDLMREIGGLLQVAQERWRDGKTELKPGEGKWWTSKPRWGGGTGGEAENEIGNSDILSTVEESLRAAQSNGIRNEKNSGKARKAKTPVMMWKELKCGSGYWDPKTEYSAIGKGSETTYDEVFMVSSLNHHISIVKMTIHDAYMEYLTSGTLPDPSMVDQGWCKPKMQRSQWFDLFDMYQRLEAFRGLWGVMAYLARDTELTTGKETHNGSAEASVG